MTDAQVNDTDPSLYSWKRKKTEMQKGYVVLKSGKKLEGQISLSGSAANVTGIKFEDGDKEIDFPMDALKSYGLTGVANTTLTTANTSVNDNKDELFTWRNQGTVMGKVIENTKPRKGYIITQANQRLEGELQLKKSDGLLSEIRIKTANGKKKFKPVEVSNYGLAMTIADVTDNGKKTYKDEARNFHQGNVQLVDGSNESGYVAFVKRDYINSNRPGKGYKYMGLYFTPTEKGTVKTFANQEISYVSQNTSEGEIKYSPYQGGFIAENTLDNLSFGNNFKELNPGSLTLLDGTILNGSVAMQNNTSVNYKGDNGMIKLYKASEIKRFDVSIDGEQRAMVVAEGKLVEEYFKGKTFWAYINPNPTTVNNFKTGLANTAVQLGTNAASAAIINADAKKNGYSTNLDSLIVNSSASRLREVQSQFLKMQGFNSSEALHDKSNNESAKNFDNALQIAIAGKEADVAVYFEEIIIKNMATKDTYVLFDRKRGMESLEGVLKGCYTFLAMDKREQKKYYDFDKIKETVKMLDNCYE